MSTARAVVADTDVSTPTPEELSLAWRQEQDEIDRIIQQIRRRKYCPVNPEFYRDECNLCQSGRHPSLRQMVRRLLALRITQLERYAAQQLCTVDPRHLRRECQWCQRKRHPTETQLQRLITRLKGKLAKW
jgi:hypothetical protein